MGKAPEAGDDVAMLERMLHQLLVLEGGEQGAAQLLVGQRLAVLERHMEEDPHGGIERGRIGPRQRDARRLERLGVAREGARRLAMHVAR